MFLFCLLGLENITLVGKSHLIFPFLKLDGNSHKQYLPNLLKTSDILHFYKSGTFFRFTCIYNKS